MRRKERKNTNIKNADFTFEKKIGSKYNYYDENFEDDFVFVEKFVDLLDTRKKFNLGE